MLEWRKSLTIRYDPAQETMSRRRPLVRSQSRGSMPLAWTSPTASLRPARKIHSSVQNLH